MKVCDNVKGCPKEWLNNHIEINFKNKRRAIRDLAYRQKRDGQFTDGLGVITQATAFFIERNITIFSVSGGRVDPRGTQLPGGGEADSRPPLAVFFHGKHYQALVPFPGEEEQREDLGGGE